MIVLGTNVVSGLMQDEPDLRLDRWLESQELEDLFLAAPSVMELTFGVQILPSGKRKTQLQTKLDDQIGVLFAGRILPFDHDTAEICGYLMAMRRNFTPLMKVADMQIAATAVRNGFAVAIRNVVDFQHEGLKVINPWADYSP
jgi:toxin FitB